MDPNVYAKKVVEKVAKSNPPQEIWCGTGGFTVWLVEALGIHWAYTLVFSKMFGLNDMAPSSEKQGE
jgi:1-acylglycerone phosphate reductase